MDVKFRLGGYRPATHYMHDFDTSRYASMAKPQLLAFAEQMLADETPQVRGRVLIAMDAWSPHLCKCLMQDNEATRRAAVMQLVQQPQAGGLWEDA
jgi:hypothetical protein